MAGDVVSKFSALANGNARAQATNVPLIAYSNDCDDCDEQQQRQNNRDAPDCRAKEWLPMRLPNCSILCTGSSMDLDIFSLFVTFLFIQKTKNRIEMLLMFLYLFIDLTRIGVRRMLVLWSEAHRVEATRAGTVYRYVWWQTYFNRKKRNSTRIIEWQDGIVSGKEKFWFTRKSKSNTQTIRICNGTLHITMLTILWKVRQRRKSDTWERSRNSLIIL